MTPGADILALLHSLDLSNSISFLPHLDFLRRDITC
jgi:hypothetical protein